MKTLLQHILLLTILTIPLHSVAQEEIYLDENVVRQEIESSEVLTSELLTQHKWIITKAAAQYTYDNPADNWIWDFPWEDFSYVFHTDGTFEVDAIIDSDGRWELRDGGRILYLYNNLRKDEELHEVVINDDGMNWYMFDVNTLVYQFFKSSPVEE